MAGEEAEKKVFYVGICGALTLLAGLMSGLTLALMSMDQVDLQVLIRSGTPQEQKYAKRIAPVLKRPHLLLVTLLLVNAAAMEALPIFLNNLVDPITSIVLSVTVVLFFGEIIPQALCTRYGLIIGAYSAWLVRGLMWGVGIVAFPISLVLDLLLGKEHGALFRRAQLKALVGIHGQAEGAAIGGGDLLTPEEINIIGGALDLTGKQASVAMTPLDKVFMLPLDAPLDEPTMRRVLASGHSRIPVHRPGNRRDIVGLVLVKELVLINTEAGLKVSDVRLRSLPFVRCDMPMYDLLMLFQTGRSHLCVLTRTGPGQAVLANASSVLPAGAQQSGPPGASVGAAAEPVEANGPETRAADVENGLCAAPQASPSKQEAPPSANGGVGAGGSAIGEPIGIITIEDVFEELLQAEIVDETDQFIDNVRTQRVNAAVLVHNLPPHIRKHLLAGKAVLADPALARRAAAASAATQDLPRRGSEALPAAAPPGPGARRTKSVIVALPEDDSLAEPLLPPPQRISAEAVRPPTA